MNIFLTAPSRVSGVSVTVMVASDTPALMVTWTTPQSDVAISQYHVQYRRNGTTSWNNVTTISGSPPATSTILTELDAGTEYNVRVRAVSAAGAEGMWSVEQTARTLDSEFLCIICGYKVNLHSWCIFCYAQKFVSFSVSQPVVLYLHLCPCMALIA